MNEQGPRVFVSATDTSAGKTRFTSLLLAALRSGPHPRARALKPLCSGPDDDLEAILAAGDPALRRGDINFTWFPMAATPSVAAAAEGRSVDPGALLDWCHERSRMAGEAPLICEGAGGWLVPVRGTWCVADWAASLRWPVVLIVANRLGCLNHTLLTVREMKRREIPLMGILLNETTPAMDEETRAVRRTNREILEGDFGIGVLGELPFGCESLADEIMEAVLRAAIRTAAK